MTTPDAITRTLHIQVATSQQRFRCSNTSSEKPDLQHEASTSPLRAEMGCGASRSAPESRSPSEKRRRSRSSSSQSEVHCLCNICSLDTDKNLELESNLCETPELKKKLSSVRNFNPDDFNLLDASSKPVSVLGYHMISGLAAKLGIDGTHLPQFVGTIGEKQGDASQADRLLALQFIEAQMSGTDSPDGGLLARWTTENPRLALALVISAMVSNDAGIAKTGATVRTMRKSGEMRKSGGSRRHRKSFHLNESLMEFLSCTMFFRTMEPDFRVELLARVRETLSATDSQMPQLMLDNEKEMELADRDMFIMQATLLVATYSHVFRKFKVHFQWCRNRVEALKGAPMSSPFKTSFDLGEGDLKSRHFAQSQSLFLRNVIAPFLQMWLRLMTGNESPLGSNVLCLAVQRLARTYDMLCDTKIVDSTKSDPARRWLSSQASWMPPGAAFEAACQSYLDNNEGSTGSADPHAVLSVCEMYGISSSQVLNTDMKSRRKSYGITRSAPDDYFANVIS